MGAAFTPPVYVFNTVTKRFPSLGDVRVDEVAARGKSGAQEAPHSKEYGVKLHSFRSVTVAWMKWRPGEKVVASLASSNAIASRPATAAERDLAA